MKFLVILILSLFSVCIMSDGVKFSRTVNQLDPSYGMVLKFDQGCASTDAYGSNDCSWSYGTTLFGSIDAHGGPLDKGALLIVDLKVDKVIKWKFSCQACGETCKTKVPIVDEDVSFEMPPCPIPPSGIEQLFNTTLPASSPTKGVKVTAVGTISVVDQTGKQVLNLGIDATIE
jgi:hypothetical protein